MHLYDNFIISHSNNGVKCYVKELNYNLNYVYFALVVKSGSFSDKKYFGEAHFVEHILLEFDRQNLYKNKIKYTIKGTTGLDKTVFTLSCKNKEEDIEKLIIMIKNIVMGKYLNKDNLESVKNDIIAEYNIKITNNNEYSQMYQELLKSSQIVDFMPIGTIDDINKINYEDLVNHFKENYTTKNMAILFLGNFNHKIIFKKINKVFSNDFSGCIENIEPIIKNNKEPYNKLFMTNKKIIFNNTSVHIFILNTIDNHDIIKNELIETIVITSLEEILNILLDKIVHNIKIEVNQFSYKNRFIHIIALPQKTIYNLKKKIDWICLQALNYLESNQWYKLLDKIFVAYYNYFQQQNVNVLQQLNQMIDNFLYNKQIYNNSDLLLCLQKLNKRDITLKLKYIINKILRNIDVYLFQIKK